MRAGHRGDGSFTATVAKGDYSVRSADLTLQKAGALLRLVVRRRRPCLCRPPPPHSLSCRALLRCSEPETHRSSTLALFVPCPSACVHNMCVAIDRQRALCVPALCVAGHTQRQEWLSALLVGPAEA
jgi:hypothetical protein